MAPGLSQFIEGESPSLIDLKKRMEAKNLKVAMNAGIDATRRFLAPHYLVWVNLGKNLQP
jgi:hypothetical protein